MNQGWNLGYTIGVFRKLYPPLVTLLCLYLGYALSFRDEIRVTPTAYFVDAGGKVTLTRCNPDSPLNMPLIRDLVERLGKVHFNYRKSQSELHAAQYQAFKPFIANNSPASEKIYPFVLDEIGGPEKNGNVSKQSSTFKIATDDKGEYKIKATNKGGGKWDVYALGLREISRPQGIEKFQIEFYVTIVEGDHHAIYQVYNYRYDADIMP